MIMREVRKECCELFLMMQQVASVNLILAGIFVGCY